MTATFSERFQFLIERHRFKEAIDDLHRALQEDPECGVALAMMGYCTHKVGQCDDALRLARAGISLEPGDAFTHYLMAKILFERRRASDALPHIRESLRLKADSAGSYVLLASIHCARKEHRAALKAAEKGLAIAPDDVACLVTCANLRILMDDANAALDLLTRARAIQPENPGTHASFGAYSCAMARFDDAVEHYTLAVELSPDDRALRRGLLRAILMRNRMYRWVLLYLYWGDGLSGLKLYILLMGVLVTSLMVGTPSGYVTALSVVIAALFIRATAIPMGNLVLLMHPRAKYAVSRRRKLSAYVFLVGVILAAVMPAMISLFTTWEYALAAAAIPLLLVVFVVHCEPQSEGGVLG